MLLPFIAILLFSGYLFVALGFHVVFGQGTEFRREQIPFIYWFGVGFFVFILAMMWAMVIRRLI
jgi:hypothetical protein